MKIFIYVCIIFQHGVISVHITQKRYMYKDAHYSLYEIRKKLKASEFLKPRNELFML